MCVESETWRIGNDERIIAWVSVSAVRDFVHVTRNPPTWILEILITTWSLEILITAWSLEISLRACQIEGWMQGAVNWMLVREHVLSKFFNWIKCFDRVTPYLLGWIAGLHRNSGLHIHMHMHTGPGRFPAMYTRNFGIQSLHGKFWETTLPFR